MLALPKKGIRFKMSSGEEHIILINKEHNKDRAHEMKNKNVLKLDGNKFVNLSFCESIIEFNPTDEKTYSSTEVWIQDQLPGLKQVAEERLKSRQEKRENKIKMPLRDMIKWMKSFQEFGRDPEKFDKRYMKIFVESGGNAEQIGPF